MPKNTHHSRILEAKVCQKSASKAPKMMDVLGENRGRLFARGESYLIIKHSPRQIVRQDVLRFWGPLRQTLARPCWSLQGACRCAPHIAIKWQSNHMIKVVKKALKNVRGEAPTFWRPSRAPGAGQTSKTHPKNQADCLQVPSPLLAPNGTTLVPHELRYPISGTPFCEETGTQLLDSFSGTDLYPALFYRFWGFFRTTIEVKHLMRDLKFDLPEATRCG